MNILAFDTCFDACSVAVLRSGSSISTDRELMRRGHAEALLPMIERTMRTAGLAFDQLHRIAVTHGPGTFTGTRVGMSAALGLGLAHDLPIVTYSSLQCVARAAIDVLSGVADDGEGILVVRDAKRGSVFLEATDLAGNELLSPALINIADARQVAQSRSLFALGSGASLLSEDIGLQPTSLVFDWPTPLPPGLTEPDARYLLQDAASKSPAKNPAPLYLRPPDATPSSRPPLARFTTTLAGDG